MLRLNVPSQAVPAAPEPQTNFLPQLDLFSILRMFSRHWPRFLAVMAATVFLGIAYLVVATSRYTSTFLVLIDTQKENLLAKQDAGQSERLVDPGLIESQVEIVKSDSVALGAVRRLNLTHDADFMREGVSLVSSMAAGLKTLLLSRPPPSEQDLERAAVDKLTSNLKAKRLGLTYVIEVNYRGYDPKTTARIAGGLAESFINSELEARYDASRRASVWLQKRLVDLRQQATDGDLAVQRFKTSNNIVDTSRGLVNEQQLSDVNSQLIVAQATTSETKARLDRVLDVLNGDLGNAAVSDSMRSDVITRLRAQYLDLASKRSDLANRYGLDHQAVVNLHNQMTEVASAAQQELKRIAAANRSDYEIAAARERSLSANLNALISQAGVSNQSHVTLRNLESTAQAYRNMYDTFLQKFEQSTQEQSVPISAARLITPPVAPDSASWPKPMIVFLSSIVAGAIFGFIAIVLREIFSNGFLTSDDIRAYAGLECLGTLPALGKNQLRKLDGQEKGILGSTPVARQTVLAPFSRFTETVRNVKVSIDIARPPNQTPIIGMVSSVPKEGKSTFSANIALLTAQMGHKVLLIDGDLHSPSLTATLSPGAGAGLLEAIADPNALHDMVQRDAITGLDFLPIALMERLPNAVNVLTSNAMAELLAYARGQYDYVFVDLPPIVPVVDVKAAAFLFDGFVFIVEWSATSRDVVRDALTSAEFVRQRIIGAVLNKADPGALKRIESYRGAAYGNYYVDAQTE
ncbi:succinoglycan biosynthesis transport protein ExoP [Rhodoblastus acidophilus]|uniref:Wzz/FepE/Etk N-terminal domain-containing protein n=1 Tax=Rhodoblastus acidophilus TaxID=1074 RepID=UPI0022248828|nr:Wzz/FepE/Etk N-terminal domain-containing protein [Rhodoblastus acidophilus]MCW2318647.1 succinoglycan biosynthesis transport protein ExoP [Rhodoblastus acidophilus]